MELLQALFLGIVQGITEFLPVSSSAHLLVLPELLGWEHAGITFDLALHFGTLLAVITFFRKDILALIKGFVAVLRHPKLFHSNTDSKMSVYLFCAIFPAGIVGFFFDDVIEQVLRHPAISAALLIGVGIIFLIIEGYTRPQRNYQDITLRDAMCIGVAQCLALIPGVSRSGITMLTALTLGIQREAGARFSFLLGTPLIAAASVFKLKDLVSQGMSLDTLLYFSVGMLAAAISGYIAIKYLLAFLRTHSFAVFGWYRIAFGTLILLLLFL